MLALGLRWIARLSSLVVIGLMLLIVIGEPSAAPSRSEVVGLVFFPGLLTLGLVLGWWREHIGALVATIGLAGVYGWALVARNQFLRGPWFLVTWLPALFFFISWAVRRYGSERHHRLCGHQFIWCGHLHIDRRDPWYRHDSG